MLAVETCVRHPYKGEVLPGDYAKLPNPDPDWVWVAEGPDGVAGYLIVAPVHGTVMLLRAEKVTGNPATWLLQCLQQGRRDCRARGIYHWIMPLDLNRPGSAAKIYKAAKRAGCGEAESRTTVMLGGKI